MNVQFKFSIGQKVTMPSGIVGIVATLSISKGMAVNRIGVEYFDKNGAQFSTYFDENELTAV